MNTSSQHQLLSIRMLSVLCVQCSNWFSSSSAVAHSKTIKHRTEQAASSGAGTDVMYPIVQDKSTAMLCSKNFSTTLSSQWIQEIWYISVPQFNRTNSTTNQIYSHWSRVALNNIFYVTKLFIGCTELISTPCIPTRHFR